jgi:hypothetical protein
MAEKDNDLVYLQSVPVSADLVLPGSAMMVSPQLPREVSQPEECQKVVGRRLFQNLAPAAVHEAQALYYQRRNALTKESIIDVLQQLSLQRKGWVLLKV